LQGSAETDKYLTCAYKIKEFDEAKHELAELAKKLDPNDAKGACAIQ
jgi:hypothetical protein